MSLRILIATHAPGDRQTAVHRSVSDRASHLRSVGCTVDVFTRDDLASPAWARLDPLLLPILLAVRDLSKYDVIVFHSYLGWVFHRLRRWIDPTRRITTITWFHGLEPLSYRAMRDDRQRRSRGLSWLRLLNQIVMPRLMKGSSEASDAVFCFNSTEAGYLASEGWAEPHRVHQVANGVDVDCFLYKRHRDVVSRLLFVGEWLPGKGTRYLVDAFTSLAALGDLELACVGTRTSADDVLAAFPAAVRPRVSVFVEADRHELCEQFARADVFVFPSLSEGFSCALLAAMASSMPVVATRVGAAVDLLEDGRNGVLVPSANASALAAAVMRLVNDVRTRTVMGEAARRTARGFTSEAAGVGFALKVLDVVMERGTVERRQAVRGSDAA
jgi:glycosyltransferase involved in cell wall biosynthesis